MSLGLRVAAFVAAAALASCVMVPPAASPPAATRPAPPSSPPPAIAPAPASALAAGVVPGPSVESLAIDPARAGAALAAFRLSCPTLLRRADASGLAAPGDWLPACTAATDWPDADAVRFFVGQFETARVADGAGFATGYYEPEILGSRTPAPGYAVPVLRKPDDLVEVDLGLFSEEMKGRRVRGRVEAGRLLPYPDRAAIEDGALAGRGLEIGWAADPVEYFFLQIQGSGRLRLPDGSVMRIGYDGQNGRDYVGIGSLLRQRGRLEPGQATMQGIMAWLRANPAEGTALMRENRSYVFFRELTGPGPIGALGLPVSPRASVAADPAFVPLGAPVWLALDRAEASGLWVAQDTGGAIKGANRFDTFWGAGEEARTIAGGMAARGRALILLPRGALARLAGGGDGAADAQR